jgi:hypothetical protein
MVNKKQKAGAIILPSEYFGNTSGRYFEPGSSQLNISDSAYGPNIATSRGIPINPLSMGPNLGPTNHTSLQTGGKHVYDYIVNPETNRKVSIHTRLGKNILLNYLK